jgi:hypothetical protein
MGRNMSGPVRKRQEGLILPERLRRLSLGREDVYSDVA